MNVFIVSNFTWGQFPFSAVIMLSQEREYRRAAFSSQLNTSFFEHDTVPRFWFRLFFYCSSLALRQFAVGFPTILRPFFASASFLVRSSFVPASSFGRRCFVVFSSPLRRLAVVASSFFRRRFVAGPTERKKSDEKLTAQVRIWSYHALHLIQSKQRLADTRGLILCQTAPSGTIWHRELAGARRLFYF